jgi:hypothetical protein
MSKFDYTPLLKILIHSEYWSVLWKSTHMEMVKIRKFGSQMQIFVGKLEGKSL